MKKTAWTLLLAALLAVAALTLAGCGGGGGGAGGAAGPKITLTDFAFTPNTITASKGKVTFTLVNKAASPHNFAVPDLGIDVLVDPGKTVTKELDLSKTGQFKVICTQPGHEQSGMIATLTVS